MRFANTLTVFTTLGNRGGDVAAEEDEEEMPELEYPKNSPYLKSDGEALTPQERDELEYAVALSESMIPQNPEYDENATPCDRAERFQPTSSLESHGNLSAVSFQNPVSMMPCRDKLIEVERMVEKTGKVLGGSFSAEFIAVLEDGAKKYYGKETEVTEKQIALYVLWRQKNCSSVHLGIDNSNIVIFVKLPGKNIPVHTTTSWTIGSVKHTVEEKEKIDVQCQHMVYAGKPLLDDLAIAVYNIPHESTIFLNFKLLGGMNSLSCPDGSFAEWSVQNQSIQGFAQRAVLSYIDTVVHPDERPTKRKDAEKKTMDLGLVLDWIHENDDSASDDIRSNITIETVRTAFSDIQKSLNLPWAIDFIPSPDADGDSVCVTVTFDSPHWNKGIANAKHHAHLSSGDYDPDHQPLLVVNPMTLFSTIMGLDQWYGRLSKSKMVVASHRALSNLCKLVPELEDMQGDENIGFEQLKSDSVRKKARARTSLGGKRLTLSLTTAKKRKSSPPRPQCLIDCLVLDIETAGIAALSSCSGNIERAELISYWQADVLDIDLREIETRDKKV